MEDLKRLVRTIPDYPKPGILFRDVTTLLGDAWGLSTSIELIVEPHRATRIDAIAAIEARGFIIGGAVAERLGCGFVPMRKQGRLPWRTIGQDYQLEYGTDRIEMHEDAVEAGARVLVVDDLLATGGTAEAAIVLLQRSGAVIIGASFLIDLPELGGRRRLEGQGIACHALMSFEGH